MLELSFNGGKTYWSWITALVAIIAIGIVAYLRQYEFGLGITGLSRDISWGFYIAQLTFLVGVAASAVMVVLPYYLHNYKAFGKLTVIGEFTAVASISMCGLFLFVDIGQPARALNVFLYSSPSSIVFWDSMVLIGYLAINMIVGWKVTEAERNGVKPEAWVYPIIYLSIPWAFAIHTVTAFIYSGIPDHIQHFRYLYFGLEGHSLLVPWMWSALLLMSVSCILPIIPATRKNEKILPVTCVALFIGTWIDKGVGLVTGGFVPTPFHRVQDYMPTLPELLISTGIFAIGLLVLTVLLKLVVGVRMEDEGAFVSGNYRKK